FPRPEEGSCQSSTWTPCRATTAPRRSRWRPSATRTTRSPTPGRTPRTATWRGSTMKLERRSVFGWGATAAGHAPCDRGLVIHYDSGNLGLHAKDHSACRTYWKNTRRFHMGPSRGWADLGYAFRVCPHGIVMEGRGAKRAQAAQPGGNTTWTSCTLMTGPAEDITPAAI